MIQTEIISFKCEKIILIVFYYAYDDTRVTPCRFGMEFPVYQKKFEPNRWSHFENIFVLRNISNCYKYFLRIQETIFKKISCTFFN